MLNYFTTNLPALQEHCKASVDVLWTSSTDWISYANITRNEIAIFAICFHVPKQIEPPIIKNVLMCLYVA
jgi:hypothetical protein